LFRKRKPMTRGKRITLATLVAVVITATILLLMPPPSRKITIDLDTDPGTRVTGSFSVDGLLTPFDAETPSLMEVRGKPSNVAFAAETASSGRCGSGPGNQEIRPGNEPPG